MGERGAGLEGVTFADVLAAEWRPALGCTEPASVAYAASLAADRAGSDAGPVVAAHLVCDARIYKNCYAVGIPNSGGRSGILWTLAIGCLLPDASAGLEGFRQITPQILALAQRLLERGAVTVDVDATRREFYVDVRVQRVGATGRAVLEQEHTRVTRLERDGVLDKGVGVAQAAAGVGGGIRERLARGSFGALVDLAEALTVADAAEIRRGVALNLAIARHGLTLFPPGVLSHASSGRRGAGDSLPRVEDDPLTRLSALVMAGVYARMSGEDFVVMSLSGSGNKGITCSVPLALWGADHAYPDPRVDRALALALLVTSATTWHLGTLSAVCGCSNAAGIGLAAGLVYLEGGDEQALTLALNNMVGNVAGMICDGAKIGCALKTMTSVDAAFRAASLAMAGIGIPPTDGIVGVDGLASLANLGRIARRGMTAADPEILSIMQDKLRRGPTTA